jgi:hypothetical protein
MNPAQIQRRFHRGRHLTRTRHRPVRPIRHRLQPPGLITTQPGMQSLRGIRCAHHPKLWRQASDEATHLLGGAGGARTHDPGIMSAHALCAVPQLHRRSSGGSVDVEYSGLTSPSRLTWRDHTPLRRPDGRGVTLLGRGWQSPRAQTGGELQRGVRGLLAGRGAASIAQARGVADQQAWKALASPPSVLGGFRRFSPVGLACLRGTTAS